MARQKRRTLPPLDERPGHLIRRLQQISIALFMEQARAFGITPVQYAAIFAVNDHPGMDQTALCNAIALDRSTIGDVVGRLEMKKLITRRNGADRRTKSLYVRAAGRKLIRDIEPAVAATQRLILAPLASAERALFTRMLKRVVHLNNGRSCAPRRSLKRDARARLTRA
jgi:MarR family transcriptional regulator, lower aerobic nicotinate degradation pathway regulator